MLPERHHFRRLAEYLMFISYYSVKLICYKISAITLLYQESISQYESGLFVLFELDTPPLRDIDFRIAGELYKGLGITYEALEQSEQAIESYMKALEIFTTIGDRSGESGVLSELGRAFSKSNQLELAIIFYKQAVNIIESVRNDINDLSIEQQQSFIDTVADSYRTLADLLLQQDRILEAQRVLDLLKVQELDEYLRSVRSTAQTESGVALFDPEVEISNKAILIGRQLAQLKAELNEIPLADWSGAQRQELEELNAAQEAIIDDFEGFIASPEIQALVAQLTVETREQDFVAELDELINLQNNLRELNQNAVMIYPLILEDRLELVLVTPFSEPTRYPVDVDRTELNRAITNFRLRLKSPTTDPQEIQALQALSQQLYGWLVEPMAADLEAIAAETILYAPDGPLRYIPLAALYDGEQWLAENYRVNHITAASLQDLNLRPDAEDPKILAAAFSEGAVEVNVGNQTFPFSGLPFARTEVENLGDRFPNTNTLFNDDFSRATTELAMDSHTIVHLATHAAFLPGTPSDSFILFGNGEHITLEDLKSWKGTLNQVDLFVLSACETGLGGAAFGRPDWSENDEVGSNEVESDGVEGDGIEELGNGAEILGFGYLMQEAGAEAAIASLWKVSDGGTQVLMDAFYVALNNGYSKAEALQRAQQALITGDETVLISDENTPGATEHRGVTIEIVDRRTGRSLSNSPDLSHPYYWAPFILIGNGL